MSSSSVTVGKLNVTSINSPSSINISSSTNSIQIGDYTLPSTTPTETSVLSTDSNGTLSFVPISVKTEVTAPMYFIDANDSVVAITGVQLAFVLTLPDPSLKVVGDILYIRKEVPGTNTVSIMPFNGESISGENSYTITTEYGSVSMYTNGTSWFVLE